MVEERRATSIVCTISHFHESRLNVYPLVPPRLAARENARVSLFTHTHGDRFPPPGAMPTSSRRSGVPRTGPRDGRTRPTRDRRARARANDARVFSSRRSRRVSATTRDAVVVRRRCSFIVHPKIRFDSNAMMTSSTRFRAMMVAVFACALALVASPLGADAAALERGDEFRFYVYDPGYEGPSTTGQGRCAYPQTSTNYFEHMGPDYCRSYSPYTPVSWARCDLQGEMSANNSRGNTKITSTTCSGRI